MKPVCKLTSMYVIYRMRMEIMKMHYLKIAIKNCNTCRVIVFGV